MGWTNAKRSLFFTLALAPIVCVFGQNCGPISSEHHYSLLILESRDTIAHGDPMSHVLFLHAASRYLFSDSMLRTRGSIELFLADDSVMVLPDAECSNNPIGIGPAIGFTARISEAQIRKLLLQPIARLKAFGVLETGFSLRQMERQKKMIRCVLRER